MRCYVCSRQAKGFGWFGHGRFTDRRVFCSMRCQDAFCRLMEKTEGHMIDPSEMEIAAMQACLAPLGEYVAAVGMERPLAEYSRDEALALVDAVVTAYQDYMLAEHERMAARDRAFFEERLARRGKPASAEEPF